MTFLDVIALNFTITCWVIFLKVYP